MSHRLHPPAKSPVGAPVHPPRGVCITYCMKLLSLALALVMKAKSLDSETVLVNIPD